MKLFQNIKIHNTLLIAGVVAIMTLLYFSIIYKRDKKVNNVNIEIASGSATKLIDQNDVLNYLHKSFGAGFEFKSFNNVNTSGIEQILDKSKFIQKSEVFVDAHNKLNIKVILNVPIVRVSGFSNSDFYLDDAGNAIPLSKRAVARVPVISGNLTRMDFNKVNNSHAGSNHLLELSKKIYADTFLTALIEQIYIDDNQKVILIPKLGDQKLEFGTLTNIDEKLGKIKVFYRTAMTENGWKKFNTINLEWQGQIVGSS